MYVESRKLIHQEVTDCISSMLNTAQLRVEKLMNTVEIATISNAWIMEEDFTPDALEKISNRMLKNNPSVISSSVFAVPEMYKDYGSYFSLYSARKGDSIITLRDTSNDYLDKPSYANPMSTGNACWVDPFEDNSQVAADHQGAIATYCRPLRMKNGHIMGIVTADFSFHYLAKLLNETEHPFPNAYYMILGADDRYLVHPDSARLFRKTIFTDTDPETDRDMITLGYEMTAGKKGSMHIHMGGVLYHVCYQPVKGTSWSLALVSPDNDAMSSFYNMSYSIIILLVIGLVLILLLSYKVVRHMVSPINNLSNTIQNITLGHFNEKIPVSSESDIIYRLQSSLATMQQSLSEHMGVLQKKADEARLCNENMEQAKQKVEDTVRQKNLFIQHATQQMRMPLNVITGFSDMMEDDCSGNNKVSKEQLASIKDMIKSNVASMNRMALMMVDATETDATGTMVCQKLDEVSCNKIAEECIQFTISQFPETSIQFETELPHSLHILTNMIHLRSILNELLHNAVCYSDRKHIMLRITQTETVVRFTVQDVGPGLTTELKDLNFLTITDILSEATGLGLPLVKRHVAALGGSLHIDTDYHDGCRIIVEMPK